MQTNNFKNQLPDPVSVATCADATFEIYMAKDLFDPNWASESLRALVLTARTSYQKRYGDGAPLFDKYDKKSAIYLVRANYFMSFPQDGGTYPVEEWLSTRLVPGTGEPRGIEDFDLFIAKSKSVAELVQQSLCGETNTCIDCIVSVSRVCGISPHFKEAKEKSTALATPFSRHRYSGLCFALIQDEFWRESVKRDRPFRYFIGTVSSGFWSKNLTVKTEDKEISPVFTPAHKFLDLRHPQEVKLNRQAHFFYVYRFPFYFLDTDALMATLQKLIDEGKITNETIQYYLHTNLTFDELVRKRSQNLDQLKKLGGLLSVCGKIYNSKMSGEELRRILDKEVADGPELKITKSDVWVGGIENLLDTANIKIRSL